MASFSTRTTYQGKAVNYGTKYILDAANKMLAAPRNGGETSPITLVQGSYNGGGVKASAGTHDGGAAIDITPFNWKNRERIFRILGVAMWNRPTLPGVWSHHLHGIVDGDGSASRGARQQVAAYHKRRNGLANNGPDTGYKMLVFPLFVFPEKAVGKPGVFYLKKASKAYEQPTTKSKAIKSLKKGAKFTVVAVVNVNGTYWAINKQALCVPKSSLTKTKPAAAKKATKAKEPAPKPKSTPKPAAGAKVSLNIGSMNVIRWRLGPVNVRGVGDFKVGKEWTERAVLLGKLQDKLGVSVVATQEAGQYVDGDRLCKAFGAGWSNILHGDDAGDLTMGIHWDKKRTLVAKGKFTTAGSHHNWVTWAILKDKSKGVVFMISNSHLEYRPRGTKTSNVWDILRENQTKVWIKESERIAKEYAAKLKLKRIPIIFTGDFNADKDDAYDGPGEAFKKAGYRDAETLVKKKTGPETTYNGGSAKKVSGRRLDRFMVKPDEVAVDNLRTVAGWPATDHNPVAIKVTVSNG